MQLYDMRDNKIVERDTGFAVIKNISGKRAKAALKLLNEKQTGFQGFTPPFFLKSFEDERINIRFG